MEILCRIKKSRNRWGFCSECIGKRFLRGRRANRFIRLPDERCGAIVSGHFTGKFALLLLRAVSLPLKLHVDPLLPGLLCRSQWKMAECYSRLVDPVQLSCYAHFPLVSNINIFILAIITFMKMNKNHHAVEIQIFTRCTLH